MKNEATKAFEKIYEKRNDPDYQEKIKIEKRRKERVLSKKKDLSL